jgi:hypothetical protein
MDGHAHHHGRAAPQAAHSPASLTRTAISATIALAIGLAFLFGYALAVLPLLRSGLRPRQALRVALAADTASIAIMEIVDNLLMLAIPGAMSAGLASPLFWGSLAVSLAVAGAAAVPVNRWLIARDRGHVLVHAHHH